MNGDDLDRICNHSLLTPEEEQDLGSRSFKGDREAREQLINRNLRLVASIAKGFVTNQNTLGDCISTGTIGLMKAAERYNPAEFKTRFSTYATWWIKETLLKAHWEQECPMVRVPNWIGGLDKKLRDGKELTEKEQHYLSCADAARRHHSDVFALSDDLSPAAPEDAPEFPAEYKELLAKALERLKPEDSSLLKARFGLPPYAAVVSQRDLALVEGVNSEVIRHRQQRALERLRAVFDDLSGGSLD